jgi:hypothetical protein
MIVERASLYADNSQLKLELDPKRNAAGGELMSSKRLYAVLLVVGMLTASIVAAFVTVGPSGIAYACNGPSSQKP